MSDSTLRVRMMLQSYEQQLLAARRLVRYRAKCRMQAGENPEDPDPSIKRRALVEKVAKEIYECLIYTGGNNIPLMFTYPPGKRLHIVRAGPEGQEALTEEEQRKVRMSLWRVTREKINASMLEEQKAD